MKTRSLLFLAAILGTLMMFSCGTKKEYSAAYTASSSNTIAHRSTVAGNDKTADWETTNLTTPDRKMIYNASITIVVKKPDTANIQIVKIAKKYSGYVLSTGSAYTTIRVKADSLYYALTEINKLGHVKNKNVYAEDITEEYTDLSIRLENAQKARTRYLELMAKAANVTETLAVEKELERLNTDIDLLEGKINKLNHLEEYSTITVYVQKIVKPGPVGFIFKYLFKGVKFLFVWN